LDVEGIEVTPEKFLFESFSHAVDEGVELGFVEITL